MMVVLIFESLGQLYQEAVQTHKALGVYVHSPTAGRLGSREQCSPRSRALVGQEEPMYTQAYCVCMHILTCKYALLLHTHQHLAPFT